jgi:gas vesicle protein
MNENSGGEFGAFLAGFVIGGLVGAAAALILAPQSGSETRSQIAGKGHDLREAGGQRMHQARDSAGHYIHRSSDQPDSENSYDAQEQARIILDSGRPQSASTDDDNSLTTEDDSEGSAAS